MKWILILCLVTVAAVCGVMYVTRSHSLSLEKLPGPAQNALREQFPQAEIIDIEADTDDGVAVYEFTLRQDGQKIKVKLTAEGRLIPHKGELLEAEVSAKARHTLQEKYPQAKILKVDCDDDDGQRVYKFVLTQNGRKIKVKMTAAGQFLAETDD